MPESDPAVLFNKITRRVDLTMKRTDLEKWLRLHGCYLDHRGGNHDVWINPALNRKSPVPRHSEINTGLGKGICKQLGILVIKKR